jgi:hypothetical protein
LGDGYLIDLLSPHNLSPRFGERLKGGESSSRTKFWSSSYNSHRLVEKIRSVNDLVE